MSIRTWEKQKADGKITHLMPYRERKAKNAERKRSQRERNLAMRRANSNRTTSVSKDK